MRSGFPHNQGGACSVFQDWSNLGARRLPQDINVTPVPVVYPEVGTQNNMVATQYPEELRGTYSQVPLQQGYQSQKLYHQQESHATITSTGFQHPRAGDGACISQNMQMSRKDNADFYSSAQHSSYFGTSAYENSVRRADDNSGQQKEYSRQNFSRHFQKKSNWNHDTGLQQPLSRTFKDGTSSAALQIDRLEAQAFPLQDRCSSATVCKTKTSMPLLEALLKTNSSELPCSSEETNGNIELNAIFLNKRCSKSQHVKGLRTVLNCGQARTQNLDHSRGTPSIPYQQQVSSRRLSQPSTDKLMSAGKTQPPTDVEIQNFLAQKLLYFRSILTQKNRNPGHSNKDLDRNSPLQSDSIVPKVDSVAHLPTTSAKDDVERQSHNWGANEQCTVGQAQYPRIMMDVAATCTKSEDESPVVLTAVPEMTWDELTEKQPSSPDVSEDLQTKSNSVASENKTFEPMSLIEKQTIEDHPQCGVTWEEVNPHSQPNSAVDRIQILNVVSLFTNQSEGASWDAGSVHLQTDLSTACSENKELVLKNPQYEDISDDDPSQPATELPATERFQSAGHEDPQYEFISEEESPQIESVSVETSSPTQVTVLNNTESPFENEDYGHLQGRARTDTVIISVKELVPKKQVSPDAERRDIAHCSSPFVETDETGPLYPKCDSGPLSEDETDDDDDWLFIPISISDLKFESDNEDQDSPEIHVIDGGETGDQEQQCDNNPTHWPSPKPVPASPSQIETFDTLASFMKQALCRSTPEHGLDSEGKPQPTKNRRESVDSCATEDSCDYSSSLGHNYLTASRLRSEPLLIETDDSEGEGNDVTSMPTSPNKSLDKSGMKSLRKTNGQNIPRKDDIIILDSEDESDQNCKKKAETEGRPETMDSQRGTVKEKLKKTRPLPVDSPAPRHQPIHQDTPFEEVTRDACSDPSPSTEMIGPLIEAKAASKKKIVIIIDSDTDDDQNYMTPRRNSISSCGSDSGDAPRVEQNQQSPKTVDREYRTAKENLPETTRSVPNPSLPHPQSTLQDTQLKEVTQGACSDLSDGREKCGQLIEAKCDSEHVQHKTNRQTTSKRKAFCDSGKVVEKSHSSKKKAKTKGILSSGSEDSGYSLCAPKDRPSTETVDRLRGTVIVKQPKKRSSEDSSEKQPQSVCREVEASLGDCPVIPRFVLVEPPQHNQSWKLVKETAVRGQGKAGSQSPKTSMASSNNTDSCANKKVRFVLTSKPANDQHRTTENIQANVKPRIFSRQHSLPTFSGSSSSSDLSEARQSSSSSRDFTRSASLPAAKQSTSILKHVSSSSLQQSRSYSNPSTLNPPDSPTKGPSSSGAMQSLKKKRAKEIWEQSYIPTRKDKKTSPGMKEDLRTTTNHLKRAARPDRRRRQKSQKSSTPLMKKSKIEAIGMTKAAAIEMTKAAGRDPPGEQRNFVGDNYKWSEKQTVAKPTKGSSREGIRYRPHPKTHW
ncbi:uncharacterized protein LOC114549957 isoform X2 [Perca flavescens]|uniref:uncharacterized protein LOC114549957 isoform X2 n=1 Tax=Perca flavescens TaxID=8167 RepID=UPI00106E54ED|nr:uncharacterized protein LOC114549957 isoform X2 [Perca flavescens]